MTKPISEYTLNEVMEICKNSFDCDKCRFFRAGCRLSNIPPKWDLHEKNLLHGGTGAGRRH